MSTAKRPPCLRPGAWLLLIAAGFAVLGGVPALAFILDHAPGFPASLALFMLWLVVGLPAALVGGHLLARLERAVAGARTTRGWAWLPASAAASLVGFFAVPALWPAAHIYRQLHWGRRLTDDLLGTFTGLVILTGGALLLAGSAWLLRRRPAPAGTPARGVRAPSVLLAVVAVSPLAVVGGLLVGAFATDPQAMNALWPILGGWFAWAVVVSGFLGAVWARMTRAVASLEQGHRTGSLLEDKVGASGLAGALLLLHLAPVWFVAHVSGEWASGVEVQLIAIAFTSVFILAGVALVAPALYPLRSRS